MGSLPDIAASLDKPDPAPHPAPEAAPLWRSTLDGIILRVAQNENIDSSQAKMDLRFLCRQNARVALDITIFGPRRMKPHAIWSWTDGKIFYYDSGGKRWKEEEVDPSIQPPGDLLPLPLSA